MSTIEAVLNSTATGSATTAKKSADEAGSADRFLTLLVAQMENQDPLNPMDNAQVTSQMAQISTVSGIESLNTTMQAMSGRFLQMQTLQGASMVGRDVILAGNQLSTDSSGQKQVLFDLAATAGTVKVEVLSASGTVVDTVELQALNSGRHEFDWTPKPDAPLAGESFRVTAKTGAATISSTPLMRDRVAAVATGGESLTLELSHFGSVPFEQVKTFN